MTSTAAPLNGRRPYRGSCMCVRSEEQRGNANGARVIGSVYVGSNNRAGKGGGGGESTAVAVLPLAEQRALGCLDGQAPQGPWPGQRRSEGGGGNTRVQGQAGEGRQAPAAVTAEPPRSQASVGEQPLLGPRPGSPTVEAIQARRLSRQQHSAWPPPLPSPQLPSLPSLALVAAATHTVLASAVVLSLAGPCPWQADRRGRPSGCLSTHQRDGDPKLCTQMR